MKQFKLFLSFLFVLFFVSCKKNMPNSQNLTIPNGDFEYWNGENLLVWQTNNCPPCVPPYKTYIVQKTTDAYSGHYATKFIYNGNYKSWAVNKFAITIHPSILTGYVKSNIADGDTAVIHIDLFSKNNIVDSGNWYGISSIANYEKIEIPISQASSIIDSALIKIVGGGKQNTELYVDHLVFIKN